MSKTKVDVLRELCEKITGEASTGTTVVEVLQDICDNYPADDDSKNNNG